MTLRVRLEWILRHGVVLTACGFHLNGFYSNLNLLGQICNVDLAFNSVEGFLHNVHAETIYYNIHYP